LDSSPQKQQGVPQQSQAIQKITITEKLNQHKVRGGAGRQLHALLESPAAHHPKQALREPPSIVSYPLSPGNSTQQKWNVTQDLPGKGQLGKMATVDQKLQHFARQSVHNQSESTSRYVTFRGERIDNLKMSLGADSSQNTPF